MLTILTYPAKDKTTPARYGITKRKILKSSPLFELLSVYMAIMTNITPITKLINEEENLPRIKQNRKPQNL